MDGDRVSGIGPGVRLGTPQVGDAITGTGGNRALRWRRTVFGDAGSSFGIDAGDDAPYRRFFDVLRGGFLGGRAGAACDWV